MTQLLVPLHTSNVPLTVITETLAEKQISPHYGHLIATTLISITTLTLHMVWTVMTSIYRFCITLLWPARWGVHIFWNVLVVNPTLLLMHLGHVLWPVTLFCLGAIACGLIIGGCAGFMAEGISSLLLAATWGAESVKREVPEITVTASEKDIETQASIALGQTDPWDSHSTDHNMGSTEAVQERSTATKSNGMSSYWETSFFAEKHDEKGKGRESSLDNVETWRTSLTRQSSSSSVSSISSSHSYPLDNAQSSSAAVNTGDVRKRAAYVHDKYEWTEEEDEFPSRRNSQ